MWHAFPRFPRSALLTTKMDTGQPTELGQFSKLQTSITTFFLSQIDLSCSSTSVCPQCMSTICSMRAALAMRYVSFLLLLALCPTDFSEVFQTSNASRYHWQPLERGTGQSP